MGSEKIYGDDVHVYRLMIMSEYYMEMRYQSGFWKIISSFGQLMLLFWSLDAICELGKVVILMAGETTHLDIRITPSSQIERFSFNPDMEP
jgi:hypothetical protein